MNPFKLFLIFLVLAFNTSYGQVDTAFWFVAPDVSVANRNFDRPIVLRITTYNQPVVLSVTEPGNTTAISPPILTGIAANSSYTVDLTYWMGSIETSAHGVSMKNGLYIHATGPISVYYEVVSAECNCDPEIFVLKGANALGTNFIIPSQNYLDNSSLYTPYPYSEFDIVASRNKTTITITPTSDIVGYPANIPFTVKLDSGEAFSCRATSQLAAGHLGGSIVTSDKPVAVTVSDDLVHLRSCEDLIGDQLVPIAKLGTEYIAVNGNLDSTGDELFITATENGTTVSANGAYLSTINKAQTLRFTMSGLSTYITTSKPAYVLQLTGVGCELGAVVLPHINCTGNKSISFTRSTDEAMFINLIVKDGGQHNFYVNGNAGVIVDTQFHVVPGTSGIWYAARIPMSLSDYPQGTLVRVLNTTDLFQLGALNGKTGTGARFGYFGDYEAFGVHTFIDSEVCADKSILLIADSVEGASYSWIGPSGFNSNKRLPVIPNATSTAAGMYTVTATIKGCLATATANVNVKPSPSISFTKNICADSFIVIGKDTFRTAGIYKRVFKAANGCDSTITATITTTHRPDRHTIVTNSPVCEGDSLVLNDTGTISGAGYTWYGPDGFVANDQDTVLKHIDIHRSGKYLLAKRVGDCIGKDSVEVSINPLPHPKIIIPSLVCKGDTLRFDINSNLNGLYSWLGPAGFSSNSKTPSVPNIQDNKAGKYVLVEDANGCMGSDSVTVDLKPSPAIPYLSSNGPVCPLDTLCLYGDSLTVGATYSWQGPLNYFANTNNACIYSIPYNGGGVYTLIADLNGCKRSNTIDITLRPWPPLPQLSSNSPLQTGQTLLLNYNNPQTGTTYEWAGPNSFSSPLQKPLIENVTIDAAGIYRLKAILNGCANSNMTLVTVDVKQDTGYLVLYPNANDGNFSIKGVFRYDQRIPIHIYNSIGQLLYSETIVTTNKKIEHQFLLKDWLASGVYMFRAATDREEIAIPFVVDRR